VVQTVALPSAVVFFFFLIDNIKLGIKYTETNNSSSQTQVTEGNKKYIVFEDRTLRP